jgi:Domain of unknown function (DUF4112)
MYSDTNTKLAKLQSLRKLSDLWDRSLGIPGTRFRVGLDSLIGLLPVGGDFIGILLSVYILLQAIQFKLPTALLVKMIFNIVLDGAVGSIPILGDIFDTTWKANTKNVNLLEAHLREPGKTRQKDTWLIYILLAVLILILVGLISCFAFAIWLAVRFFGNSQ